MVFNITEHVQGVQYLLRFWRSDGVLNLNTHFYSVLFDLFCIFRENTHEQQLIQAKILYQCPSRHILDFVYGGSHFSTGVIFLRVRHVKNRPLWHFFYTWDTFFYGQGSFLYDEKWPLGRFSTGVVIRRYTGRIFSGSNFTLTGNTVSCHVEFIACDYLLRAKRLSHSPFEARAYRDYILLCILIENYLQEYTESTINMSQVFGLVVCGLTSHSAIFQLYSDGTVVQFSKFWPAAGHPTPWAARGL